MINNINSIFSRIEKIEQKVKNIENGNINKSFSRVFSRIHNLENKLNPENNKVLNKNTTPVFNTNFLNFISNNDLNEKILKAAEKMEGKQYWSNSCAIAVNDVLKSIGIDIKDKTRGNPAWVPNYANLGKKISRIQDLKPGDIVIYNNEIGQGGYDHIGIYAGNGYAYNVSTAYGHKWVKTKIGSTFQEGRRLTDLK